MNTLHPDDAENPLFDAFANPVFVNEYMRLAHAMQSGLAFLSNGDSAIMSPKHLRVGLNMRAIEHGVTCTLLVRKGIITAQEFCDEMLGFMRRELEQYEKKASSDGRIKFG